VATIFKKNTSAYKTFRNLYNKTLRAAKKVYYKKSLEKIPKTLRKPGKYSALLLTLGGLKEI